MKKAYIISYQTSDGIFHQRLTVSMIEVIETIAMLNGGDIEDEEDRDRLEHLTQYTPGDWMWFETCQSSGCTATVIDLDPFLIKAKRDAVRDYQDYLMVNGSDADYHWYLEQLN